MPVRRDTRGRPGARGVRGARAAAFAGLLALAASIGLAGCGAFSASQGEPAAEITGVDVTPEPMVPTPWPHGTVGRYGLRVDPVLLARLPASVGGLPLVESVDMETPPLDNEQTASVLESFSSAYIGTINDPDWAAVSVMRLKPDAASAQEYVSLRDEYMQTACSQAGGLQGSAESRQIGDWSVDVGTCAGGPVAYTLRLDTRTLVTALEMGTRELGRQMIEAIP